MQKGRSVETSFVHSTHIVCLYPLFMRLIKAGKGSCKACCAFIYHVLLVYSACLLTWESGENLLVGKHLVSRLTREELRGKVESSRGPGCRTG